MVQVVLNNIVPYGGRYMTLGVDFPRRARTQALSQLLANFCGRHFERQRGINQQMAMWRALQYLSRGAARCNFGGYGGGNRRDVEPRAGFHAHMRKFEQ